MDPLCDSTIHNFEKYMVGTKNIITIIATELELSKELLFKSNVFA